MRYKYSIVLSQYRKYKPALIKIYNTLVLNKTKNNTPNTNQNINDSFISEAEDDLRRSVLMAEKLDSIDAETFSDDIEDTDIGTELDNFFNDKFNSKHDENILELWKKLSVKYPKIYMVSQVIFSIPCSQVSVERSFSTLKFIYTDLRSNIDKIILEKILFTKTIWKK